jgi:hypothetical protein
MNPNLASKFEWKSDPAQGSANPATAYLVATDGSILVRAVFSADLWNLYFTGLTRAALEFPSFDSAKEFTEKCFS